MTEHYIKLRFPGKCCQCGASKPVGTQAWHNPETKTVTCTACLAAPHDVAERTSSSGIGSSRFADRKRKARSRRSDKQVEKIVELVGLGVLIIVLMVFGQEIAGFISDHMVARLNDSLKDK